MPNQSSINRLKSEKSLYLQQHRDNPIHWWPYSPEAILKAQELNRPIFLSIGYSACHWCHVMAHESFEDQKTANFINENFVAIKVDREEYPDLDQYYQLACQLFNKQGGWPLSAFLLPNMRPFFVGTYFPAHSADQKGTLMHILKELHHTYHHDQDTVLANAQKAHEALELGAPQNDKVIFEGHFPHPMSVMSALEQFQDNENGGFGEAPKFPTFSFYEWGVEQILEGMIKQKEGQHIVKSLENIFMGGIFDHCRGGIHRYSTDKRWLVPHFEKMLYDQAGYLKVAAKFSLIYPSPLIYDGIIQTLDYLQSEMQSDSGYFLSAQDADSEGVEGLYFTFTEEEFEEILAHTDDPLLIDHRDQIKSWFQITEEGNFTSKLNIISLNHALLKDFFTPGGWEKVRAVKKALLKERKTRVPPVTDNKGVASWNFHLQSALLDIAQYCQIESISQKALDLFVASYDGIYKTFIIGKDDQKWEIRQSTTKERSLLYFENYVFFAEMQLRAYEILGNQTFKDNFEQILNYINKTFIKDDFVFTRSHLPDDGEQYPNMQIHSGDASFKSPLATYIGLIRRGALLLQDPELLEGIKALQETVTHQVLKNPLGSGEGMRVLTYPKEAYRLIKMPYSWIKKQEFKKFIAYLLPRFVLDYHYEDNEIWQICQIASCELKGEGIQEFMSILTPKTPESTEENNGSK